MTEFILNILNDYVALIGAIIAIFISILSFIESKRKSVLSSISSNRIVWISELREEIHKFLEEYLKKDDNKYNLRIIRAKIELYLRNSEMYNDFLIQLEKCSLETFSENNYKVLVTGAQKILNDAWRRMKREAGISYKYDKRLTYKIKNEKKYKDFFLEGSIMDEFKIEGDKDTAESTKTQIENNQVVESHPAIEVQKKAPRYTEETLSMLGVVLNSMKIEYQHADEQYKNLDNRAYIFLTLLAALLVFFVSSVDLTLITNQAEIDLSKLWVIVTYFASAATAIILMLISFLYVVNVLKIASYLRVDVNDWVDMSNKPYLFNGNISPQGLYSQFIVEYAKSTKHNRSINGDKAKAYDSALRLIKISIFFIAYCYISKAFV